MAKISIIVPVYNKEREIARCLSSLVDQTLTDIEIIVINDGSTDQSKKIILEYQKKYKNIFFIDSEKNEGIGKTRNKGLAKAKGKYLGFVDSDDFVDTRMYEKYYKLAEKKDLSMVTGHYYKTFDNGKNMLMKTTLFPFTNIHKNPEIINFDDYGPCNKIFLRSMVEEYGIRFEEKLKYEDMPFVCKTLFHSSRVGHIEEAFYYYNVHIGSETTVMDQRVFDIFKIMDIVNDYYGADSKLKEQLEYLNILQITRYMLRQKYQKKQKNRVSFVKEGYYYLNDKFPNWHKNLIYRKEPFYKRLCKDFPFLMKGYLLIFGFLYTRTSKF